MARWRRLQVRAGRVPPLLVHACDVVDRRNEPAITVGAPAGGECAVGSAIMSIAGMLVFALIVAWMAGGFRANYRDGVIVLEDVPEHAEVLLDGTRVTLLWPEGGGSAEVRMPAGRPQAQVKLAGFQTFGDDITLESGEKTRVRVRLVGLPMAPVPKPPDESQRRVEVPLPKVALKPLLPTSPSGRGPPATPARPEDDHQHDRDEAGLIPAGEFLMGSPDRTRTPTTEKPQHRCGSRGRSTWACTR